MSMATWRVVNERTGIVLGTSVTEAMGSWESLKGLMFLKDLPQGHGLIFRPARGIHTHFMRFPIDLVFFNGAGYVTKIRERMPPWRFDFTMAHAVIELNAEAIRAADVRVDDHLVFIVTERTELS
jgi:uncharacterized membrane protein (UPF0127 family)